MKTFAREIRQLLARAWAALMERDARIVRERFEDGVERELSVLHAERSRLKDAQLPPHAEVGLSPFMCHNRTSGALDRAQQKVAAVDRSIARVRDLHALFHALDDHGGSAHA